MSGRGGKREGAGRKVRAVSMATLSLKIEPELLGAWNERKARLGISGPALLARLLHREITLAPETAANAQSVSDSADRIVSGIIMTNQEL